MFQDSLAHPHQVPHLRLQPDDYSFPCSPSPPPRASARGHQRSRTAVDLPPLFTRSHSASPTRPSTFLPTLFRPASLRSLSPERVTAHEAAEFDLSSTAPREAQQKHKRSLSTADKLASWFDGSSDPVNISLVPSPNKDRLNPIYETESTDQIYSTSNNSSVDNLTKRPQKQASPTPSSNMSRRFNFFGKQPTSPRMSDPSDADELARLDINCALFPAGHPDEFSPAAFKNLQMNAEGLLQRYQETHKDQQKSLKTLNSTRNAQMDELDAEKMRNEHLKLQLQEMAEKATQQEKMIAELRAQLRAQRPSLEPPEVQTTIRMISHGSLPGEETETPRPRYRRHRSSDISTPGESEAGSDASSVISVFSDAPSSALSQTTTMSSPISKSSPTSYTNEDCPKCHGVRSTEAWDVIGMMKMESTALKQRISQLECAQDDALHFLSGLSLDSVGGH